MPNLISYGAFMRAGSSAGTLQGDAIRNITGKIYSGSTGSYTGRFNYGNGAMGLYVTGEGCSDYYGSGDQGFFRGFTIDASRVVPTGYENRPKGIGVPVYFKIS